MIPIAEDLICDIEREGVILENRDKIHTSLANAITECRFEYLVNSSGIRIGFFTWCDKGDKILLNNLFIYSQYRDRRNLLQLRDYMRNKFKVSLFYWKNRKHGDYEYHT